MNLRRWLIGSILTAGVVIAIGHVRGANDATADSSSDEPQAAVPVKRVITPGITRGGKPPAASDTLLLSYADDPDTVNPLTANDNVSEAFQRLVYDYLADRKYDNPDEWEPALAESWEFDPKTLEYTIHLRKGVKWHPITLPSGKKLPATEFTARDVKFTFDCILNKNIEAAHLRSYYEDPSAKQESERYKIKVSLVRGDKYTVKVKWTKPYFLADDFTLRVFIMPRHVFSVDEKGDPISFDFSSKEFADGFNNHWANRAMCGTGPMMFKEWTKEQRLVLERNPDYWGEPYYFSRLIYRHIKNPNTAVQQMLQGELDWNPIPEKDLYLQSQSHPNVEAKKVILAKLKYPSYRYLGYNLKRDFFKDQKVRWAIGHAIPLDEIIANIYHGLAVRLTGPFLPDSKSNDKSLPLIDYDLDKARKLLDEAGWKMEEGASLRSKMVNGKKVEAKFDLMIYSDSPSYTSIATIVKENCRKIGVDVGISSTNWALMLQKLRKKDFDACILGWVMDWKDDPFQIWHGSQADLPESSNSIGYQNPEVDKLIEQLRVTMSPDKQIEIYHKIHRLIYEDQPYTFLFMDLETAGYNARIENVKFYPIRPCVDTREWYAKTPRVLGP
ncbi:MAG TPA: ABC transporter substrate-binding protein [Pirellulales bacterium]|jgi:ABC-type transport system substrate-binding protein|nr:ABC transporter substrate-binding protein [Pirellulales bacterium]